MVEGNQDSPIVTIKDLEMSVLSCQQELQRISESRSLQDWQQLYTKIASEDRTFRTTIKQDVSQIPQIRPHYRNLMHVMFTALERIRSEVSLGKEQVDHYVIAASTEYGEIFFGKDTVPNLPYFHFGKALSVSPKISEFQELIPHNLSSEQERELLLLEEPMYKVHLQVVPEQTLSVLKKILENKKYLPHLTEWKMLSVSEGQQQQDDFNQGIVPTFVFYCHKETSADSQEALRQLVEELATCLEDLPLTRTQEQPRFSAKVFSTKRGKYIEGFYYAQGNGDTKALFLQKTGGVNKMNQYYDPRNNWATRKGVAITFI